MSREPPSVLLIDSSNRVSFDIWLTSFLPPFSVLSGIGVYGNGSVAPDIGAGEFAATSYRVTGPGPEAENYRTRALWISGQCRAAGGRKAAVDRILELATQLQ